jgi:mono/diheme cytochrome c family protein
MLIYRLSLLFFCLLIPSILWSSTPNDWEAPDNYEVQIDSSGFSFPTSIQFVTNPGSDPKSPLYYVTELRGRIKVVTQDRSVSIFAEETEGLRPKKELPDLKGEFGMTGLCLDEAAGQMYVTSAYYKGALLFNKIMRFGSPEGKLGLKGTKNWEMTDVFSQDSSSHAHQIGNCFIGSDKKLYVGIGDGHMHHKAQLLQHANGKLLRMNLDGTAPKDNPFFEPKTPNSIASYVFAYGLRNPHSLAEGPQGEVYIAENGPNIDRLVQIVPGRNYLWDGSNASMLINGIVTWSPAIGPASMVYLEDHPAFAQWHNSLLVSASQRAFIQAVPIDNELGATAPPETFLKKTGKEHQYLVAVAIGSDGIYFADFLPPPQGSNHIMKVVPSSKKTGTSKLQSRSGESWYAQLECSACHSISGKGGKAGPALDNLVLRLEDHLNSKEYEEELAKIEKLNEPIFVQYKEERSQLRQLKGRNRVKYWINMHLKEPRFDNPEAQMPNFQLSDEQSEALTSYLMTLTAEDKRRQKSVLHQWANDLKFYLSAHLNLWLGISVLFGILFGIGGKALFRFFWRLIFVRK